MRSDFRFSIIQRHGATETDLRCIEPLFRSLQAIKHFESLSEEPGLTHHAIRHGRR